MNVEQVNKFKNKFKNILSFNKVYDTNRAN
jgi:hypothetical protein